MVAVHEKNSERPRKELKSPPFQRGPLHQESPFQRATDLQNPPFLKGDFISRGTKPMLPFNKKLKTLATQLRKNMTEAESFLWQRIRRKQLKGRQFYRQKNIGNYIVDFYCPSAKVIVELDGGQHYTQEAIRRDQVRNKYLESLARMFHELLSRDREDGRATWQPSRGIGP
jgi:very-short-patch-repair endonuclease